MDASNKGGFGNEDGPEGSDRRHRSGDSSEESMEIDGSASSGRGIACRLTERLRDVLRDESDGDLLLDRREVETGIMQWLRALDLHVLGACRADERLKPLLKLNISTGVAEDMLLAQLSQHFEASEVGMLARCLCVPLVSIRVGKINKQGNLLCPSATRGHLNLSLLPSSNMRISFIGDDGCINRLAILSRNSDSSEVVVEEISADSSGRSFLIRLLGSEVVYFWCSEKSKLHGSGLLAKMKDLLRRKPTLSQLTGIREARLESFATHIRTYLLGSSNALEADPIAPSRELHTGIHTTGSDASSSLPVLTSSRSHSRAYHASKGQPPYQNNPSSRPYTLKDGISRISSSMGSGIRDKLSRYGDNNNANLFTSCKLIASVSSCDRTVGQCEENSSSVSDGIKLVPIVPQSEIPCVSSSLPLSISSLLNLPPPPIGASKPMFSPYYCWCPPCPSSFQYSVSASQPPPPTANDESIPLPPLSSLFSSRHIVPSVASDLHSDFLKLPALNLPLLLPEPRVRLPLPVNSLATLPTSQQISSFAPYMSDPIVHTPVIDVCSSGQGYLVSAGPAISSALPPLLPSFVNRPLIPNTESAVEKSARETLRMLMASTPESSCQMPVNIFPPFLGKMKENLPAKLGCLGSQGLHRGIIDFDAVALSLSSIGLSSSRDKAVGNDAKRVEPDRGKSSEDLTSTSRFEGYDDAEDSLLD